VKTLAGSPIRSVNTKCKSSLPREQCYTASTASLVKSKHRKLPAAGTRREKSGMHLATNSSAWLMADGTAVTVTLPRLRTVPLLCHLFAFIPLHKLVQQHRPCGEMESPYLTPFRERTRSFTPVCKKTPEWFSSEEQIIFEHRQMVVLTGSIFVVVAEVKVNCSAEFKNVTPLVLIDHFVFWLLLKARNRSYWNVSSTPSNSDFLTVNLILVMNYYFHLYAIYN